MPTRRQPNILLITTDQQRADTLGSQKPTWLRMPHLSQLAAEGTSFEQARVECPVCVASRTTIMTGCHPLTHGMLANGPTNQHMSAKETLPARLHDLGYHTAAIGKMHFTPRRNRHGFDEMTISRDYFRQSSTQSQANLALHHGLGQNEHLPGLSTVPEAFTQTAWIADQARDYVMERRDPTRPFFLWASFGKPHPPLDPPEPYYSMYQNSPIPEPQIGNWAGQPDEPSFLRAHRINCGGDLFDADQLRAIQVAYYGLCTQIDYNIGRIFAGLVDAGILNETLILFTSDHGEYLGDHKGINKGPFHEAVCRVPFILRLPCGDERLERGSVSDQLVTGSDILPTMVCAAGGRADGCDGRDIIAVEQKKNEGRAHQFGVLASDAPALDYMAITDGRWKYIYYPEGDQTQLFNLSEDPNELKNLAGESANRELCQSLHNRLVERCAEAQVNCSPRPRDTRTETQIRACRWLGYHTEETEPDVLH